MRERGYSTKLILAQARTLPYIFLFIGIFGFLSILVFGSLNSALKSLYILMPVALASLIAIKMPGLFEKSSINSFVRIKLSSRSFLNLVLLFILLFILSIILLVENVTTPLSYYVLLGAMTSLVFVQILSCDAENSSRRNIVILEILFIAANLTLGQTLRLPLYFGHGDILPHMYNIDSIVTNGHFGSEMLYDYQYFPGFHIYGAMGNLLSNLELDSSYFIFNGPFFILSIPIIYLLVSKLTRNPQFPLIAALLYSLSAQVIFYSMYTITRAIAFVLCLAILYLLIRGREDLKIRAGAFILVFPLLLVHHTTIFHFSIILLILVILEIFLYRSERYIGFNFLLFFILAYLGYWVFVSYSFFQDTVLDYFSNPDISEVVLPVERPVYLTFTNNAGNIIMVFLAVLGIVKLLFAKRELLTLGIVFTIFSIVAILLYTPAVSSLFNSALLTARLELLVTPFLVFAAAAGLLLVFGETQDRWKHYYLGTSTQWKLVIKTFIVSCIIFFLACSTMLSRANYNDLSYPKIFGDENRQYFMESELTAFSFAHKYKNDLYYTADYDSSRYLRSLLELRVNRFANIFDPPSIDQSYFLLRDHELQSRGQLFFIIYGTDGRADQEYLYQLGDSPDLKSSWERENKIYDDGSVYMYMTKSYG